MSSVQREAVCCICGDGAPMPEMFGLALFPMSDVSAGQQWFAHPACVKEVMRPEVVQDLRDEIAAVWPAD
jgi:hypothetical protein